MAKAKKHRATNKTRKTMQKRFKKTNPKGNREAKLKYTISHDGKLMTKENAREKNRKERIKIVYKPYAKKVTKTGVI